MSSLNPAAKLNSESSLGFRLFLTTAGLMILSTITITFLSVSGIELTDKLFGFYFCRLFLQLFDLPLNFNQIAHIYLLIIVSPTKCNSILMHDTVMTDNLLGRHEYNANIKRQRATVQILDIERHLLRNG